MKRTHLLTIPALILFHACTPQDSTGVGSGVDESRLVRLLAEQWGPAVVVNGGVTLNTPALEAAAERCPGGGPLVVNVYATLRNAADHGADGHVWALDAARESMQIWQVGPNTYCLKRQYAGTFTTFAGVSPEGTGTVSGGVIGRWNGEIVGLIHGTFAPTVSTRGFVGDFDWQCQQDGTCLGWGTRFTPRVYFSSIDSFQFLVYGATFEAGACGVWRQSLDGNTGDIVC
jgi:hypothetical protein